MRYIKGSEERSCSVNIPTGKWYGPVVCMRTKGHKGKHIASMGHAARADGVCFGCRVKIGKPCRKDCFRKGPR